MAIVRATALEIASEPLALLVTMSALAISILSPALHYHRFGEPARMARDAGLSALLIGSVAYVILCTVKTIRREAETGTLQMALAHSVSRSMFLTAKVLGVFVSYLLFFLSVVCVSLTVVNGAEIGGRIALKTGSGAPLWGPSLACAVSVLILPPFFAALLNRFSNFRWTLTTTILFFVMSVFSVFYRFDVGLISKFFPVAVMIVFPSVVYLSAAAAAAVKWRENIALSVMGVFFLLTLPFLGNYYLSDVLMKGGELPLEHLFWGALANFPLAAGFLLSGIVFFDTRDVGGEM